MRSVFHHSFCAVFGVYLSVKTCDGFVCLVVIVFLHLFVLTFLFSLSYVTGEFSRLINRGRARF